jgi:hypothetical protein
MYRILFSHLKLLFSIVPQSVRSQEQQWVTYENPYFGVTIQHPSNWEVVSSNTDASPPPKDFSKSIVEFGLNTPDGQVNDDTQTSIQSFIVPPSVSRPDRDAHLTIRMQVADSYLDTDTMQVKNQSLENFISGKEQEVLGLAFPTGEVDLQVKKVRDNYTKLEEFLLGR